MCCMWNLENLKNMAMEKESNIQEVWLHHGTKHHKDTQLQSREHICRISQFRTQIWRNSEMFSLIF